MDDRSALLNINLFHLLQVLAIMGTLLFAKKYHKINLVSPSMISISLDLGYVKKICFLANVDVDGKNVKQFKNKMLNSPFMKRVLAYGLEIMGRK